MTTTQKGTKGLLKDDGEWMKHLRPKRKRIFWHRERNAERTLIKNEQ